jgi:hypothetical protein
MISVTCFLRETVYRFRFTAIWLWLGNPNKFDSARLAQYFLTVSRLFPFGGKDKKVPQNCGTFCKKTFASRQY